MAIWEQLLPLARPRLDMIAQTLRNGLLVAIRGRYVRLNVEAVPSSDLRSRESQVAPIALSVRDGRLVAAPATGSSRLTARFVERAGERVAVVNEALAYFIPEHVA